MPWASKPAIRSVVRTGFASGTTAVTIQYEFEVPGGSAFNCTCSANRSRYQEKISRLRADELIEPLELRQPERGLHRLILYLNATSALKKYRSPGAPVVAQDLDSIEEGFVVGDQHPALAGRERLGAVEAEHAARPKPPAGGHAAPSPPPRPRPR